MNAEEIRKYVSSIAHEDWTRSNAHGCSFAECLVEPRKVLFAEFSWPLRESDPESVELRVVLEEHPGKGGYAIVFDDSDQTFGLAVVHPNGNLFHGYNLDFWGAYDSMQSPTIRQSPLREWMLLAVSGPCYRRFSVALNVHSWENRTPEKIRGRSPGPVSARQT